MKEFPKMLTIEGKQVFVKSAEEEAAAKPKRKRRSKAEIEAGKEQSND